ncbi:MAG TPA: tripartite tricarboxylate transporter substrate binding protein, partial [Burkholderiales bacterium]
MIIRMSSVLPCVVLSVVLSSHAAAQTTPAAYPVKPIRIIVPFTPGGPADMIARPIAQGLTESWGQQVITDNRPGG